MLAVTELEQRVRLAVVDADVVPPAIGQRCRRGIGPLGQIAQQLHLRHRVLVRALLVVTQHDRLLGRDDKQVGLVGTPLEGPVLDQFPEVVRRENPVELRAGKVRLRDHGAFLGGAGRRLGRVP